MYVSECSSRHCEITYERQYEKNIAAKKLMIEERIVRNQANSQEVCQQDFGGKEMNNRRLGKKVKKTL